MSENQSEKRSIANGSDRSGSENKKFFGFIFYLGLLSFGSECMAMDFEIRNGSNFKWIQAFGEIVKGDTNSFVSISRENSDSTIVVLNSNGGDLFESIELGRYIRSMEFDTYIPKSGVCYSACFFAMIGGKNREVSPNGTLGYHQFVGSTEGESGSEVQKTAQLITSRILEYTIEMGVDTTAIARGLKMPPNEMYIFSQDELQAMGINTSSEMRHETKDSHSDCPFPEGHKVKDPMGLYPGCKYRY